MRKIEILSPEKGRDKTPPRECRKLKSKGKSGNSVRIAGISGMAMRSAIVGKWIMTTWATRVAMSPTKGGTPPRGCGGEKE